MINIKQYSLGFMFDEDYSRVIVVEKLKPEFQKGLINGVGGKFEDLDSNAWGCMTREFFEETGALTHSFDWSYIGNFHGTVDDAFPEKAVAWEVFVFYSTKLDQYRKSIDFSHKPGVEQIFEVDADTFDGRARMPNLNWLVPIIKHRENKEFFFTCQY